MVCISQQQEFYFYVLLFVYSECQYLKDFQALQSGLATDH